MTFILKEKTKQNKTKQNRKKTYAFERSLNQSYIPITIVATIASITVLIAVVLVGKHLTQSHGHSELGGKN